MSKVAVFFGGVWLWQHAQRWPTAVQRKDDVKHSGVGREWARSVPASPNFVREIPVETFIEPITATGDLTKQFTMEALLWQLEDQLVSLSKEGRTLAWQQDSSLKADVKVAMAPGSPATVLLENVSADWTIETSKYVLFRNPATGEGFVTLVAGWDDPTETLSAVTPVQVTPDWEVRPIQIHIDDTEFVRMDKGSAPQGSRGAFKRNVTYVFSATRNATFAPAYLVPRGNA